MQDRLSIENIITTLAVAVAYFGACWLGLSLDVTSGVSSFWPASGLLIGLLLLARRDQWLAIGIGAFAGGVAANLNIGFNPVASVGYVLVNLGEAFAANWLIRRHVPDAIRMRQPRDVAACIAICAAAVTVGAPVAAALGSIAAQTDFFGVWRTWWAADVGGVITIVPVILATAALRTEAHTTWSPIRWVEAVAILVCAVVLSGWIFLVPRSVAIGPFTQPLPMLPVVIWASIRFGLFGGAWSVALLNAFCIWGTHHGLGPYAAEDTLTAHLAVQAFTSMTSLVCFSLATAVDAARRSAIVHRELVMKLHSAAEAERAKLAHELHDEIVQKLAVLKMQLELEQLLGSSREEDTANGSVAKVEALISDVRELSRGLRPAPFEEGQLIPALAAMARTEGRRAGLRVFIDTPVPDVTLSREAELACYRVVREAVTNIVKHARAQRLAVSVQPQTNFCFVRVVDDGEGFDVGPASRQAVLDGHLGLVGMKERVQLVGGTLKIRSKRGAGTMVECRVPFEVAA